MANLIPDAQPVPIFLDRWGITVPFVTVDHNDLFVVIRHLCDELEIDYDTQIDKIMADEDFNKPDTLVELRVPTRGGRQRMWGLRKPEAAMWVGGISARRVKPSVRGKFQELRQDIIHAADKIAFGDLSGALTVSSVPARGGELHVGDCPRCHTHLIYVVTQEGSFLKLAEQ